MSILYSNDEITRVGGAGYGHIGGFFQFKKGGDIFALSNNHVIADLNRCAKGDPVCRYKNSNEQLGTLAYWYVIQPGAVNTKPDAAFFKVDREQAQPRWYNNHRPKYFCYAEEGLEVQLHTSGESRGIVRGLNRRNTAVEMDGEPYWFENLFTIESLNANPFSIGGDSGSLVYCGDDYLMGIIVGGDPSRLISYALPFVNVIFKEGFSMEIAEV
ncbi:MAG: hypothetical protein U0T73_04675 [Chitinophagales bacterium]